MKFIKTLLPYVIIVIVVVLIRTFVITPAVVKGTSMVDTLFDKDIVLLKKYDNDYDRFKIIVFDYKDTRLVKRVVGLPGEHVEYKDNKLYINGKQTKDTYGTGETKDWSLSYLDLEMIPEGYYFVMGDNRNSSTDSRVIGLVKEADILGTTSFRIWPLNKIGSIK